MGMPCEDDSGCLENEKCVGKEGNKKCILSMEKIEAQVDRLKATVKEGNAKGRAGDPDSALALYQAAMVGFREVGIDPPILKKKIAAVRQHLEQQQETRLPLREKGAAQESARADAAVAAREDAAREAARLAREAAREAAREDSARCGARRDLAAAREAARLAREAAREAARGARAARGATNQPFYSRSEYRGLTREDLEMYEFLGVEPNDKLSKIKSKRNQLLRKFHPDKSKLTISETNEMTSLVVDAYNHIVALNRN
jgi:hypothetical protein